MMRQRPCAIGVVAADKFLIDKRIGDEGRKDAEVDDVAAQSQQSAIGKEESLHHQHRGNGQKGRRWAEQNRQQQAAAEVAA